MTGVILSLSLLVAAGSAVIEIRQDYLAGMRAIESALALIESTHLPALTEAVWSLDPVQIRNQMTGIANLSDVSFVAVRGKFPFDIEPLGKSAVADGLTRKWPIVQHSYDLVYRDARGADENIGRLDVEVSLRGLYARLRGMALRVVLTEVVRSQQLAS
ncbi:MAG TPA: hypothetical protein VFM32_05110, partial [Spongiibacteraceae bacterium]|nr:hypothetical protein [Spongiibacteraceae bacterium]